MANPTNERIALLRSYMKDKNLQAFIIPSTDAHLSEYIPEHWESRRWISGFTGSAGTVVITLDKAGLWTDSRYFLQVADELAGCEIVLFKDRIPGTISIPDWLLSELKIGNNVGIDGNVYAAQGALILKSRLQEKGINLISTYDPFDTIWHDRPALPKEPIFTLDIKYAGESASSKIKRVLEKTKEAGAGSIWVSTLDAIAWLFNIRGNDVPYNPVAVAFAYLSDTDKILFIDKDKLTSKTSEYLKNEGVITVDYEKAIDFIGKLANSSVCIDSSKITYNLYNSIAKQNLVVDTLSIVDILKSMKNEVETQGFRNVMVRDGVALAKFLMWLEEAVPQGKVTEYSVCLKLKELRSQQENFAGESFYTIAGYGANAAKNHYHPTEENSLEVKPEGLLLVDSGGQYYDGTTDITRTIAVGKLTDEMKKDFTLVLRGMIGLSMAVFPARTRGSQIDMLARKAMWESGINYLHGTGHGVGHYLNVHEGPHSIRPEENSVTMQIGMVASNEPGIYRDHKHGVRTENMMVTKLAMSTEFGDFYSFETLTLCPIDTKPIVKEMMSKEEVDWLNSYHQTVYDRLSPHLTDVEKAWLKSKTMPI